ncbi:hypothetical protein AKJ57_03835 [candidate division MSBL1 archaeon SCGC-AAA259A05]|uniref:Uncharacterized protein n=1 Tax=candidate division MSBL1 archaeon SCGC-AAA259A05 TaxID=1698259 RepID=A0A133U9B0_9EURY|nr:hypothetical protein AKJ57_03835 [candidate division MSBL1 archaeon SCGC-AAA259A05]
MKIILPEFLKEHLKREHENVSRYLESLIKKSYENSSDSANEGVRIRCPGRAFRRNVQSPTSGSETDSLLINFL